MAAGMTGEQFTRANGWAASSGHTRRIGLFGQLLGFEWLERAPDHAILKVPGWLPRRALAEAVDRLEVDYRLRYGPSARITVGRRLVRFDWEVQA